MLVVDLKYWFFLVVREFCICGMCCIFWMFYRVKGSLWFVFRWVYIVYRFVKCYYELNVSIIDLILEVILLLLNFKDN